MVIWIFGQPGAGKTTLANEILSSEEMKMLGPWVHIDGDTIRDVFQNKDYSREGRLINGEFAVNLCKFLSDQAMNVVVSVVTPYKETRQLAADKLEDPLFVELYYNPVSSGRRDLSYMVSDYSHDVMPGQISLNTDTVSVERCLEVVKSIALKSGNDLQ